MKKSKNKEKLALYEETRAAIHALHLRCMELGLYELWDRESARPYVDNPAMPERNNIPMGYGNRPVQFTLKTTKVGSRNERIKNYSPANWPQDAPPYESPEGWEYDKALKLQNLRRQVLISWLEKQGSPNHLIVAQRLREIAEAPIGKEGYPPLPQYAAGRKEGYPPLREGEYFFCDWGSIESISPGQPIYKSH